jgi:hypothetical protein
VRRGAYLAALAALLFARGAAASDAAPPGFVEAHDGRVTFTLTSRRIERSLELERASGTETSRDALWQPLGAWLGLRGHLARGAGRERTGLRGELAVGYVPTPYVSMGGLGFAHTVAWVARPVPRVHLVGGLRAELAVDLPHASVPVALVGPALGLGWRALEVGWAPALSLPLHRDERPVFGGTLSRGPSVALLPLGFHASIAF